MSHERLTLADELADAMRDAPDLCAQCGQPLDDDAQYLCDDCTESAYCDGSDICEPWDVRFSPAYQPPDRYGISVFGVLALACLIAALIGTAGLERVRAQDTTLTAPHAINGRIYEWEAPEAGCQLVRWYEDGSATAFCPSGLFNYDPDGSRDRGIGWYVVARDA